MGSAEREDYGRFPKAILLVRPRDKEKPEPTATGESDGNHTQLDAKPTGTRESDGNDAQQDTKHGRPSLSSISPHWNSNGPTTRRWSISVRPVSATLQCTLREHKAGEVRIALTMHQIYFVRADTRKLETLSSFGGNKVVGGNSLEISRLDDGDWQKVVNTVEACEIPNVGPAVIVPGKLHGPLRFFFWKGLVKFVLVANTSKERDSWVSELRHRVAPWSVLRKMVEEKTTSYSKKELSDELKSIFLMYGGNLERSKAKSNDTNEMQTKLPYDAKSTSCNESESDVEYNSTFPRQSTASISCNTVAKDALVSSDSISKSDVLRRVFTKKRSMFSGKLASHDLMDKTIDGKTAVDFSETRPTKVHKGLQRWDMAEKFNTNLTGLVIAGASVAKLADQAQHVADVAGKVGDAMKIMGAASSIFHLVGLAARMVAKIADEKKAREVLPQALTRIMYFLGHVLDSAVAVLLADPSDIDDDVDVARLLTDHVFSGLKSILDIMAKIEDHLMRSRFVGFMKSKVLQEVEEAVKDLEENVIRIVHTKLIADINGIASSHVGDLPTPPLFAHFFVGREDERDQLKLKLEKYGNAVVTSEEGGMGKTQLMIAFARDFVGVEENVMNNVQEGTSKSAEEVDEQHSRKGAPTVIVEEEFENDVAEALQGHVPDAMEDASEFEADGSAIVHSVETLQPEKEDEMIVPRRIVIWVEADGRGIDIVDAIASVVGKLMGRKMKDLDRLRLSVPDMINMLREIIMRREQECLLCFDGVDSNNDGVDKVLSEICSMSKCEQVFVLISSQSKKVEWKGLKPEQMLRLGRLTEEETQSALWRTIHSMSRRNQRDENVVLEDMKRVLEVDPPDEVLNSREDTDSDDSDDDEAEGDGTEADEVDPENTAQVMDSPRDEHSGKDDEALGDEKQGDSEGSMPLQDMNSPRDEHSGKDDEVLGDERQGDSEDSMPLQDMNSPRDEHSGEDDEVLRDERQGDSEGSMTRLDEYMKVCRKLNGHPRKINEAGKVIRHFGTSYRRYLKLTEAEIAGLLSRVPPSGSSTTSDDDRTVDSDSLATEG